MTINSWNTLLDIFKAESIWDDYEGIIVLHGTDTLAYTAALLSIALAGAPIPVCMVSAQQPLMNDGARNDQSNGYANFRAAVELILNGIAPNVYVVYRNADGKMLVHYGAHVLQCANYSNDFHSKDDYRIIDLDNARAEMIGFETRTFCPLSIPRLSNEVICIEPYVGLDYSKINVEGLNAIIHGTYHSQTVCVERSDPSGEYGSSSVLYLLDKCRDNGVSFILAPCDDSSYCYSSTLDALQNGASCVFGMTREVTYVKALIASAMGKRGGELVSFLKQSINHEFVYQ